jgi:hypothetical protein
MTRAVDRGPLQLTHNYHFPRNYDRVRFKSRWTDGAQLRPSVRGHNEHPETLIKIQSAGDTIGRSRELQTQSTTRRLMCWRRVPKAPASPSSTECRWFRTVRSPRSEIDRHAGAGPQTKTRDVAPASSPSPVAKDRCTLHARAITVRA